MTYTSYSPNMTYTSYSNGETVFAEIPVSALKRVGWDINALLEYLFYEGYYNEANSSYSNAERESDCQAAN